MKMRSFIETWKKLTTKELGNLVSFSKKLLLKPMSWKVKNQAITFRRKRKKLFKEFLRVRNTSMKSINTKKTRKRLKPSKNAKFKKSTGWLIGKEST